MASDSTPITYRPYIDALRGLSVLLVVGYHAFPEWVPGGFIGVDIFFVISGYLITSIILKSQAEQNFSLKQFYARRIRRLFPALLLVLAVTMLVGWLVLFPDEFKQTAYHAKYSAVYWLNFILIGELGYFDIDSAYKPLLHLWSLSIEEQYYAIWPLILLIVLRQHWIHPLPVIALIALLSFAANVYFINDYPDEVYFHTATRIWQLALGSVLAVWTFKRPTAPNAWLLLIGIIMIAVGTWLINENLKYPGWWGLLPTLGALLVIHANSRWNCWGGLVSVGLISYPLYLWHWVVFSFVTIYLGKQPGPAVIFAAVALSFGLAFATWKTVERVRYHPGRHVPILLVIGVLGVGLSGVYAEKQNGLPERDHLAYLSETNLQFTRTPNLDPACDEYSKTRLSSDRMFHYCRGQSLDNDKLIAVIGDSHAHAIYPGIAEQAKNHGYGTILLANSSCPTLVGFPFGANAKEIAACETMVEQILYLVQNDSRIEKVFISTRGPSYMHGEVKGEFTETSVKASLKNVHNPNLTWQSYFDGFGKTLAILEKTSSVKSIYYFLENPELDFLPKNAVARPFDKWGVSIRADFMDLHLFKLRMKYYSEGMRRVGKLSDKLTIIDPTSFMCDEEKCYSFKNAQFLYADDDHFSVYGAKYAAEKIRDIIFYE
ncbi:MAG: acyltransferase [Sedimenticola sp.]|nr:acyltransferase [Sedimenticola sp.]